jgi:aspartate aminotransferase
VKLASSRLDPVKPSASAWISQAAKEAKARGEDVIDLGLGEPDFDTPSHIIEAAHAAALRGETRYPPTNGTLEMRQAVVDKMARENNLSYAVDEVIVSNGAKQVLFNAMMATLEQGDEVLMCAPYFGQYKDIVLLGRELMRDPHWAFTAAKTLGADARPVLANQHGFFVGG